MELAGRTVACIGSRDITAAQAELSEKIGRALLERGARIRSGNAPGADQAFARGANRIDPERVELVLPWGAFEAAAVHPRNAVVCFMRLPQEQQRHWYRVAAQHHPAWTQLAPGQRKLIARNGPIVDGTALVLAWLNPAKPGGGGTGQGVRVARALGIPVVELREQRELFADPLDGLELT